MSNEPRNTRDMGPLEERSDNAARVMNDLASALGRGADVPVEPVDQLAPGGLAEEFVDPFDAFEET